MHHGRWKLFALCSSAGALLLASVEPPGASATSTTLSVSAVITANCVLQTTSVSFGAYDPEVANLSTALTASGKLSIACTRGSTPSISLDFGQHGGGPAGRNMLITTSGLSDTLRYQLYQPPGNAPGVPCAFPASKVWGDSPTLAFTPTSPTSRQLRSYSVCGAVPAGQPVRMGYYADTVIATVNF